MARLVYTILLALALGCAIGVGVVAVLAWIAAPTPVY
jgi:hypothetical protein